MTDNLAGVVLNYRTRESDLFSLSATNKNAPYLYILINKNDLKAHEKKLSKH